ncbi:unnamed protein product [Urochloa humidicola]
MPSHQSPPLMQQQRGLLGPRPATLKVTTTNNKKEKRPVIIYVESPKVVHAHPSEFKSVVQRLTGAPPPPAPPLQFPFQLPLLATTTASSSLLPPMASNSQLAAARSLGLFISDDQLISPAAFLYDHHHQSTAPSLGGACYRHGDLFAVNLQ